MITILKGLGWKIGRKLMSNILITGGSGLLGKNIIPIQRVNLGFKVCVDCSTTEQYGCAPLINHKTGNSIQIMSSSDAARISKMTQRRGYGTLLK